MGVGTLISLEEYLRTSYRPDCDFVEGHVLERNLGKKKHGYAQGEICYWFRSRKENTRLHPIPELRMRVAPERVRIADIAVSELPLPDEEVFATPPYLCIEIMSPGDTRATMPDRMDDYLRFGVANIWVIDPWKHAGWRVSAEGWVTASDRILCTADGKIAMPLADVLLQ